MKKLLVAIMSLAISWPMTSDKTVYENGDIVVHEVSRENSMVKGFINEVLDKDTETFSRVELMTKKGADEATLVFLEDQKGLQYTGIFDKEGNLTGGYTIKETVENGVKHVAVMSLKSELMFSVDYDLSTGQFSNYEEEGVCGWLLSEETCACIMMAVEACVGDTECTIICGLTFQFCIGSITIACILSATPS